MKADSLVPLSLLLVAALAGCAGASGTAKGGPQDPSSSVAASGEPLPDAGVIQGVVVDDSSLPIEGADVALIELDLKATTDDGGAFSFTNLPPATYKVAALKLGYESVAKAVSVASGEVSSVTFVLRAIAVDVPHQEVYGPFQGYFECRAAVTYAAGGWTGTCGTVCPAVTCVGPPGSTVYPNDKSILRFNMTSDNYQTFVGEMRWTPSAYGTSTSLRVAFSHDNRTSTHWWCSAEGPAPLQFRYEKESENSKCANTGGNKNPAEPSTQLGLRMYANTPFGTVSSSDPASSRPVYLTLQQRIEILASVFYGEPAPADYQGFPDG